MNERRIAALSRYFREQLLGNLIPFWTLRMVDPECGGFLTYLDRDGSILCTDKSIWVQGRVTWMFARLYSELEPREDWLRIARHGLEFLSRHAFDADGRMFFTVTREGKPLRKRRYLFSECFGVLAFAEYARAAKDGQALEKAKEILRTLFRYYTNPGLLEPKVNPNTRQTRGHAMPMILVNVLQVMRDADPHGLYDDRIDEQIRQIFAYFVKPERRALLETVGMNGEVLDSPQGRCVNPGHALESAWFLLEEARRRGDRKLIERTLPIIDWSLELGWDRKYGGILYFVDVEDKSPEQLEWDMKLWWPHNEAIYATLLAYSLSGEKKYEEWFERILKWSLKRFPDSKYGEWFGYLHRDGSVSHDLKGNMWKGPFHLPRMQLYCHLLLKEMLAAAG